MSRFNLREFTQAWKDVHGLDWKPTALHATILRRLWSRFYRLVQASGVPEDHITEASFAIWLLTTSGHSEWQTEYDREVA